MPWKSGDTKFEKELRKFRILIILFILIGVLIGLDILEDVVLGTRFSHILIESAVGLMAILGAAHFWKQLQAVQKIARGMERDLENALAETKRWQEEERDLIGNLRRAIERQFAKWELTPAEQQVAFFLIKGMSLREIAQFRGTTEQTVRQQAFSIYRKAKLAGRAELSAFFLGGLLQPDAALSAFSVKARPRESKQV